MSLPNLVEKMKTLESAAIAQSTSWADSKSIKSSIIEQAKRKASTINHPVDPALLIQSHQLLSCENTRLN